MPEVSVSVELRISVVPVVDPVALEHEIVEQGRRGSKALFREAMRALDVRAVGAIGAPKQRLERRWVATTFGRVRG